MEATNQYSGAYTRAHIVADAMSHKLVRGARSQTSTLGLY